MSQLLESNKVAIIGAGPMGLAAAYEVLKLGFKPVIFEADDRVGGMTATFDFCGHSIERYYHFHCTSDDDFFKFLNEVGLDKHLNWKPTKMSYWYQGRLQSWGDPISLLKFKGLSLVAKIRYGFHAFVCTKRKNWKPLEKYDAKTWLYKRVGKKAYDVLWRNLFELKFYHHTENLSSPWIWSRIRRIGNSRYNVFKEKLGYLKGGSQTLLNGFTDYIEKNGGIINLSSPVSRVLFSEDNSVCGVISKGEEHRFDKVISTIPLPFVPKLMPDLPKSLLSAYSSKENIAAICVIVKLRKKLTDSFWVNTNDPEMDIPGIIEYGNLNDDVGHIVYVPYYMPQTDPKFQDSDFVFEQKVRRYFKKVNPGLEDADFIDVKVNRYKYAQPICTPNFLEELPDYKTPINGLFIADTSHYYPEDRGISESIGFGRKLASEMLN